MPQQVLWGLTRGWNPVRKGEPLFADKDMRQTRNLRRFPFILDPPIREAAYWLGLATRSRSVLTVSALTAEAALPQALRM